MGALGDRGQAGGGDAERAPALRIEDLSFRFDGQHGQNGRPGHAGGPGDRPVVRVARYELARGEQALLRGSSGSGKTTLLSLIAGLLEPTLGRVEVAGRDIHALRGAARDRFRGRHIGMVFQTFHLLHGFTALENVLASLMFTDLPRREHGPRARALLADLGIDRVDATPDTLSVGQQQRVAVARAIAGNPTLVLADEPTASLDPRSAAIALELLTSACASAGAALLCVSHDPASAGAFARVGDLADLADAHESVPASGVPGGGGGEASGGVGDAPPGRGTGAVGVPAGEAGGAPWKR